MKANRLRDFSIWLIGAALVLNFIPWGVSIKSADAQCWSYTILGGMNTARERHTATRLLNGKVLLAGGERFGGDALDTAELFDPATNQFTLLSVPMKAARKGHTATLLPDGKVLIAGGKQFAGWVSHDTAELFDPAANQFTLLSVPMKAAREGHTATLLLGGKVLLAGGYDMGYLDSAEIYIPNEKRFVFTAVPMGAARYGHTATLLPGGKVLIAGGWNGDFLDSAEIYNPIASNFYNTGRMGTARADHTATLIDGEVLIAGGWGDADALDSAELYDQDKGSFASTDPMGEGRAFHTATLLPDGKVLIAGGLDSGRVSLISTDLYDPATETFGTYTWDMWDARAFHTATLFKDTPGEESKVLIAGGTPIYGGGPLRDAEVHSCLEPRIPGPPEVTYPSDPGILKNRGDTIKIKWRDIPGTYVNIDLLKEDNPYPTRIVSSTLNDGAFSWQVPSSLRAGTDYKIKVTATSYPYAGDASDNFFTIPGPKVTSPPTGSTIYAGRRAVINWEQFPGPNVRIEFYQGITTYKGLIVSSTPNTGPYYGWTVPHGLQGSNYRVKVSSTANSSQYDFSEPFSIFLPPPNAWTNAPLPGVKRKAPLRIRWEGFPGSNVRIKLVELGGAFYKWVSEGTPNDGDHVWYVPDYLPLWPYRIEVTSTDGSVSKLTDVFLIIN